MTILATSDPTTNIEGDNGGVQERSSTASPSNWAAALARFTTADDINRRYFAEVYSPAHDAEKAFEVRHGLERNQPDYVERRRALEKEHGYRALQGIEETADRLCNEACAAEDALMETPAPDLSALRIKLEKLLAIDNGSTDAWSEDYVRQTIKDMRRLLS